MLSKDTILVSGTEEIDNFDSLCVQNTTVTVVDKNAQVSNSDVEEKEVKSIAFQSALYTKHAYVDALKGVNFKLWTFIFNSGVFFLKAFRRNG